MELGRRHLRARAEGVEWVSGHRKRSARDGRGRRVGCEMRLGTGGVWAEKASEGNDCEEEAAMCPCRSGGVPKLGTETVVTTAASFGHTSANRSEGQHRPSVRRADARVVSWTRRPVRLRRTSVVPIKI